MMTVILRIIKNFVPFYIGDVMLTCRDKPVHPVHLPTADDINRFLPETHPAFVVGAVQKVNILSDRLLVAWAGSESQAKAMCQSLLQKVDSGLTGSEIEQFIQSERYQYRNNLCLLGTLLTRGENYTDISNFQYRSQLVGIPNILADVGGTGSDPVVRILTEFVKVGVNGPASEHTTEETFQMVKAFGGALIGIDFATVRGLDAGWGGGFEIATLSLGGRFQKISDVLYLSFDISEESGGQLVLSLIPRLMKYRYIGDVLIVTVLDIQHEELKISSNAITPLLSQDARVVFSEDDAFDFSHTTLQCHARSLDGKYLQYCKYEPAGLADVRISRHNGTVKIEVEGALFSTLAAVFSESGGRKISLR